MLDAAGVMTGDGLRTRHVAWADVAAVVAYGSGGVETRDGTRMVLPGLRVRPVVPGRYVTRGTAQWLHDYARAHGANAVLRTAPPAAG